MTSMTVETEVSGWWLVYRKHLNHGGNEEGGWWYESGELIAAIPARRKATFLVNSDNEWENDPGEREIRYVEGEKPALVMMLEDYLKDNGFGLFDNEHRKTCPRQNSLNVCWSTSFDTYYPKTTPHYE